MLGLKDEKRNIPIFDLETNNGEASILNMYYRFSPKEEMMDYCKGKSD